MRATLVFVGFALVGLWLVGKMHGATPWLVSFDPGLALASGFAVALPDRAAAAIRSAPLLAALVLSAIGGVALSSDATAWLAWAHVAFGAGCAALWMAMPAADAEAPPLARLTPHHA